MALIERHQHIIQPDNARGLFLPEYAIGRLVETPEEMITAIDTFSQSAVLTATTGWSCPARRQNPILLSDRDRFSDPL